MYLFIYFFFFASARTLGCVRADALVSARTHTSVRADARLRLRGRGFYRVRGVNADARGRPDEKDVWTVIFLQFRPL
jgi:hypothetical protein